MRREVPDRLVAPVVGQPALDQEVVRHVLVHGQQLDGGHAEAGQVLDDGVVPEPGVGPAQRLGHPRMAHGEAPDVRLVHDRVAEAVPGGLVGTPAEHRVGDQAERHVPGRVERARRVGVAPLVVEHLGPERHPAPHRPHVRIEQQLGRVAAQSPAGIPGPVDAVPVGLPGADRGHEPVPYPVVVFGQLDPGLRFRPRRRGTARRPRRYWRPPRSSCHRRAASRLAGTAGREVRSSLGIRYRSPPRFAGPGRREGQWVTTGDEARHQPRGGTALMASTRESRDRRKG